MKAVFYSVWILTKCIDTLFGGLVLFSRSHQHFEMSDLTNIGFPKVISWTEQWNNGFWSIFIYGPRREETCLRLVFNNTGTDQPTHPRSLILNRTMEQWILVNFYIWALSRENLSSVFFNNTVTDQPAHPRSLISAFVVHFLESFTCKLATGKISVFCSWGDWFETRFVRNPEDRFLNYYCFIAVQYRVGDLT